MPAVEVSGEFDDIALACISAGQTQGHVRRLSTRGREAHALSTGHQLADPFGPRYFESMTGAVVRATRCLLDHGITHVRGVMPHNERAMAHPVVDVLPAIDIPFVRAIGAFDKDRKRLHTAVIVGNAVREEVLGALKERAGCRKRLTIGLFESHGVVLRMKKRHRTYTGWRHATAAWHGCQGCWHDVFCNRRCITGPLSMDVVSAIVIKATKMR